MVRLLSNFILVLHILSDIRRRLSYGGVGLVVAACAAVIGITAMAAGAATDHKAMQPAKLADSLSVSYSGKPVNNPSFTRQPSAAPEKANQAPVPVAAADEKSGTAATSASGELNQTTAGGLANAGTASSNLTPLMPTSTTSIDLQTQPAACRQGALWIDITSATLTLAGPLTATTSASWHWESQSSTANGPVPSFSSNGSGQTVPAGQPTITLTGAVSQQPMVSLPEQPDYSYSVRLHIVSPFDLVSAWLQVPQMIATC